MGDQVYTLPSINLSYVCRNEHTKETCTLNDELYAIDYIVK